MINEQIDRAVRIAKNRTFSEGMHIQLSGAKYFDGKTGAAADANCPTRVSYNSPWNPYAKNGQGDYTKRYKEGRIQQVAANKPEEYIFKIPENASQQSSQGGSQGGNFSAPNLRGGGSDVSPVNSRQPRERGIINKLLDKIQETKYKYSPKRNIKKITDKIYTPKSLWEKVSEMENSHRQIKYYEAQESKLLERAYNYEKAAKHVDYSSPDRLEYEKMAKHLNDLAAQIKKKRLAVPRHFAENDDEINSLIDQLFETGFFDDMIEEDTDELIKSEGWYIPKEPTGPTEPEKDAFDEYHIEVDNGSSKTSS